MWSVGAMVLCWDVFFLFLLAHWRSLELLSQFHALVCAPKIFFAILDELKLLSWQTAKYCFWPPVFIMIFVTLWGKWKCCIVRHKSYRINGPWLRDHGQCGSGIVGSGSGIMSSDSGIVGSDSGIMGSGSGIVGHGSGVVGCGSGVIGSGSRIMGYGSGIMGSGSWITPVNLLCGSIFAVLLGMMFAVSETRVF